MDKGEIMKSKLKAVLVTVAVKDSPGVPIARSRETLTPSETITSVPAAVPVTLESVEVAVIVKGTAPTAVPAAGESVSRTSRKLPAPGGTTMDCA